MHVAVALLTLIVVSTSGTWWQIGEDLMEQAELYGSAFTVTCSKYNLTAEQERQCKEPFNRDFVISMGQGVNVVARHCNQTFKNRKWNCSYFGGNHPFGRIAYQESRETAYLFGITSAMAMYTVTRNCAKGKIDNCDCGPNPRDDADKREGFTWGRCTEDVKFGLDVTERFIDAAERPNSGGGYDATELMNLHNNEAGRLMVKNDMVRVCQCHGFSGSCEVKTCWKEMIPWKEVFENLKDKYDSSVKVELDKRSNRLRNYHASDKRFQDEDMVYLKDSPNLCDYNQVTGSLGTQGRNCSSKSNVDNSCTVLCCGRGYVTRESIEESSCYCRLKGFRLHCETCTKPIIEHFCK